LQDSSASCYDVWFGDCGSVEQALVIVLAVMMALVVFSLGCSVEVVKVWMHVQRPWAILLGLLCQFGFMPLIAYLLALGFSVTPVQAIAIIIVGSCPGGSTSNFITYWLDGDMDLSITMTSISTVLGLGTMPLCLYIYSYLWMQTGGVQIPYLNIGITSITLIVPVLFGVLVNYKWPKVAEIILRVTKLHLRVKDCSLAFCVFISELSKQCRSIAVETGFQNMPLCAVLLLQFLRSSDMVTLPILYFCFQLLSALLLVIGVYCIQIHSTHSL
uniref:Solute carrier family 10 member 6 n=1 Tax=Pygocentrus nattereri TaxID=42514 RepID=A0A3B4DNW3_PYGNA